MLNKFVIVITAATSIVLGTPCLGAGNKYVSHPPLQNLPPTPNRPMAKGNARFVDAVKGKDTADGTKAAPWKTINHAFTQLSPGDTLYLRQGVYFENLRCAIAGEPERPITVRSHPGEQVIIDGSLPEFQQAPATAWEPVKDGAPGEYRSARPYKNLRDVMGLFGDSNVGLTTYWHREDLCANNELWVREKGQKSEPVYCGPGLWYDFKTGYIHARLAHTHLKTPGLANYAGETDPRKLPLVIAPFASSPLTIDRAMHVRFQDLILRGAGFNTVVMRFGIDVEFDNVTIYAATYGIRAANTGPFRFVNSAIYGCIPPWAFRTENCLYTFTSRGLDPFLPSEETKNGRNIARMNTHASFVTEGAYEFDVFHYPYNHDWEVAYSEFTDSHDGPYVSGHKIRFHHNFVHDIQDDAVYLSAPMLWANDDVHIYQNYFSRIGMAFSMNTWGGEKGNIYIYRNIVDMREEIHWDRPSEKNPEGKLFSNTAFLMHGGRPRQEESLFIYQNTFVCPGNRNAAFLHRFLSHLIPDTERWVMNNICVYLNNYGTLDPRILKKFPRNVQFDGNLHWCPEADQSKNAKYTAWLKKLQASQEDEESWKKYRESYPDGWAAHSLVADPHFVKFSTNPRQSCDFRLTTESPAINAGAELPRNWEDPLRKTKKGRPDIGALPVGCEPLRVGRFQRVTAGQSEQ